MASESSESINVLNIAIQEPDPFQGLKASPKLIFAFGYTSPLPVQRIVNAGGFSGNGIIATASRRSTSAMIACSGMIVRSFRAAIPVACEDVVAGRFWYGSEANSFSLRL